jgi:hypothetical protein
MFPRLSGGFGRKFNRVGDRVARRPSCTPWWADEVRHEETDMAEAYYSTIFEQPAAQVWEIVRDFNNYTVWVDGAGESAIEGGKAGDTVGAIRKVLYRERQIRQRLLALSDVDRSQTYEFCGAPSLPVRDFRATLRISEVIDGGRAFVEWWATFDCEVASRDEICATLRGWFATWLESLRRTLAPRYWG